LLNSFILQKMWTINFPLSRQALLSVSTEWSCLFKYLPTVPETLFPE
jgi:hypothetical protein